MALAGGHPPYRLRWLVDWRIQRRAGPGLCGAVPGPAGEPVRAAGAVRRFRHLAARLAGGGGGRAAVALLARAPGRGTAGAGLALSPGGRADASCSAPGPSLAGWAVGAAARPGPERRGDPVSAVAGGLSAVAGALQRPARYPRRGAGGQPPARRDRAADRLFRQHPGAARRAEPATVVSRLARPGAPARPGSSGPSGPTIRSAGRSPGPRAQPRPDAAVSGAVQPSAARPRCPGPAARPAPDAPGPGSAARDLRPGPGQRGRRRWRAASGLYPCPRTSGRCPGGAYGQPFYWSA